MTHLLDLLCQSGKSAQTDGMTYPVSCVENSYSNHIVFLAMTFRKPFTAWGFSFASIHLQETFRQLSALIYKYVAFSSFDEGNCYKLVHASFVNQHFSLCRATYPTFTAPGPTTFYIHTNTHLWFVVICWGHVWQHTAKSIALKARARFPCTNSSVFWHCLCWQREK